MCPLHLHPNKVLVSEPSPTLGLPSLPQYSISGSSEGLEKKPAKWVLLVSGVAG